MKTYCSKCIFADTIESGNSCEFDIPELLKNSKKNISIENNFYVIDDYHCLYGFGKNQYNENITNITKDNIDIRSFIITKAQLKYYLIVDARSLSDDGILDLINQINQISIKPQKISIIIGPDRSEEIYKKIHKNIQCPKWTVHVFIYSLSFNNCINIALDTNLPGSNAWCVLFYDGIKYKNNINPNMDILNIIEYLHEKIIIEQSTNLGFIDNPSGLHGLCLNASLYKYLTSVVSNDILQAIDIKTDIVLSNYNEKTL